MAKTKRRRKTAKAPRKARKVVKRARRVKRGARAAAKRGSAAQALNGLRSYAAELAAQRTALDAEIQVVENALRHLGSTTPTIGRGRGVMPRTGRGPRAGSLKEYILNVLGSGGVMSVKDITAAVLAAGYATQNKTLDKSVGIALAQMPDVHKVERGRFRIK